MRLSVILAFGVCLTVSAAPPPNAADPVPLERVRLLPGPFREALTRNGEYLLRLSPDRLLAGFRKQAGLTPKGEVYGGWEKTDLAGHSLGHYLSALSLQYAATSDSRFKERVHYIVVELAQCQRQNPDGLVDAQTQFRPLVWQQMTKGEFKEVKRHYLNGAWAPWYVIHKTYAGLRDAWTYTGDPQAKEVFLELVGWAKSATGSLSDEQMQTMLACEFGGMNETFADAYALSGDAQHLALARRFDHKAVMEPLRKQVDALAGLHANTQVPKVIGEARIYSLTGEPAARSASEFFFQTVLDRYTYANGGNSDKEWFQKPRELAAHMSGSMTETCNTYNMLKLALRLFSWEPRGSIMDYYERALWNQIYSSIDRKTGMYTYKLGLYGGWFQSFSDEQDSFWCCVGTGMENPPRFTEAIYSWKGTKLWVNLFLPSTLEWTERGAQLTQTTDFPRSGEIHLKWALKYPVQAALHLRKPAWAGTPQLRVNGKAFKAITTAGGYVVVDREWQNEDTVDWVLPMELRLEPTPDNPNRVAFFYGPTVLAGLLGTKDMPATGPYGKAASEEWKIPPVGAPALGAKKGAVSRWVRRVPGSDLRFEVTSAAGEKIPLVPIWESHHQRFSAYWDLEGQKK